MANVNIKVGYTVDKTGLQELNKILDSISIQAKLPGQEMNRELQKAASTARQLSSILDKSYNKDLGTVNVTKFNQELLKTHLDMSTIKKDLENVANGSAAFNILGSAVLGANTQIKTANQSLEKMAVTLKNTIRYGISSSVFNTFTNSFQKAYDYSRQLNKSLNDIRIVTDMSADRMEDFAVTANEASKRLGASTLDYTNAALIYYQQGLSDKEAQARAEVTIKAANVTGQTGEEVSEQLTAVWNGYKVTADEAELYIDKLAAVAAGTAADLEELSTGMGKVASAANLMGVDIDQLNAQLATIVSVTRQAPESVGVALKTIYSRMSDIQSGLDDETTLGNYTTKMAQYGVNVLDANNKLRDMGEVIEEIGDKWKSMSREQQIALSQTMAGARQYNNLLSLFDNWDMYTSALDMSSNAMGTLQHQQDIYFESTEAHLKKLKATWQDLYASAIDDKEINTGIDLITNLVQTFDNFIDSFGGGMKSLAGLGVIFANVFNKQISTSIANFLENQSKMQQNIDLLEQKRQMVLAGSSTTGIKTPQEQAELVGLETQLKYAEQIQQVENGITQEQNIQLTNLQNQIAELEKRATLIEKDGELELQKTIGEEEYQKYLDLELKDQEDINDYWQKNIQIEREELEIRQNAFKYLEKQAKYSQKVVLEENEIVEIREELDGLINRTTKKLGEELDKATKELDFNKATLKQKEKILSIVKKIVQEQEKEVDVAERNAAVAEKQRQGKEMAENLRVQAGLLNTEFENTMQQAQKATTIAEKVMGVTGSLSTLATVWSSVNSLFQTWNDETASMGDKITQTFMTLSMTIPMLLSGLNSLGKAFGYNSSMIKAWNASLEAKAALTAADVTVTKARNVEAVKEQVLQNILNREHEKGNLIGITSIAELSEEAKARALATAATEAETAAIGKATIAQNVWNASLLASPLLPIIAILAAVTAAIGLSTAAIKKHSEAVIEDANRTIESEKAYQKEVDSHTELYASLTDLYKQYKNGTVARDELESSIDSLVKKYDIENAALDKLTGNYDNLIDKINEAREKELENAKQSAQNEIDAARAKIDVKSREGINRRVMNNQYIAGFDEGLSTSDEKAMEEILKQNVTGLSINTLTAAVTIDTSIESRIKLYHELQKAVDAYRRTEQDVSKLNDSELYKNVNKYIEDMKESIEQYEEAANKYKDYSNKLVIAQQGIDFRNVENFKDYTTQRDELYKQLETTMELDAKEINDMIANFINSEFNGALDKYEQNYLGVQEMVGELAKKIVLTEGTLSEERINNLNLFKDELNELADEELEVLRRLFKNNVITIDENTSIENLKNYVKQAQAIAKYEMSVNLSTTANDIYNAISQGKTLTEEQEKEVEKLENAYQSLGQILDKTSNEYLETLVKIREEEEANAIETKKLIEKDLIDKALEVKVDADTTDFDDKLAEIAKGDYEVLVAVKTDIQTDFDSLVTTMDEMESMASKIGDDFIVAAKDIEELGDAFPGILNNMQLLSDGSAQLSEESVQNAMVAAQEDVRLNTEATIQKLQNQQKELESRQAAAQTIADIAGTITEGEKINADQQATINEALNTLKEDNTETTSDFEKDSQKDVAETAVINASSMRNSFAEAYKKMSEDSAAWAESAKKNMLVATTGEGNPSTANIDTKWSATSSAGVVSTAKKGELTSEVNADTNTDWGAVQKYYQQLANAYGNAANNIQGKIGEILARNNQLNATTGNITRGLGSSGKGSGGNGGGSSKDPNQMDYLDKEIDRYHDVDIQLKQIETDIDKLNSQKEKLFGKDLIENLNKQLSLLNKQIAVTSNKVDTAKTEASELQKVLSEKGVAFGEDGTIANYTQAYVAQLNYVNGLIAQYNSMSAEAQESFKDTVEQAKNDFDTFVKNIDRYDEVVTDLIPGLEKDVQSAIDEKIDLQIEKFDMEIEIRLNLAEAERDWNDFKKKIIDEVEDDNILGNAMAKLVDFSSYYKEDNTGVVQALRKQVDNTLAELNQMDTNGWSNVYGDNRTAALEDLKKYYEELMTNLEDVLDLQKEIHESYIDMMDEAQDKFDEQIKSYEMISDLIDHDMKVISLVYGEESYSQLARYYDKQQQNFNSQLDFQRQQVDFWRAQLDALDEGSDAWENAKEKWADAVGELNTLIENSIENLQNKYLNAINSIFQNLNNKVTDGLGLDYIDEEWTLINKNAEQYLDTINSLYEVQKLESKYLDALDNTDSISAQRQIKEIMDEELADLRERDKLTQYDIERANKKYEIALKQIALQEAQQNKTKMRLRRDSQGNYRYEYTTDGDQVGQLQSELNDMYNSLYNFDKSKYQDNLNQMYSVWVEFQEKMAEAAQINDPVARSERELLLQNQYEQLINGLTEQNATVRENLHESAFDDLSRLYDVDVSNFQNMSDQEKEVLMGDLIPYWESGVQHMTEVFAGEDGFLGVCRDAFDQLHDATKDYEDGLDELENAGRIDFESIGEGIDQNIERTQQLITDNNELINSYEQELSAINNVIGELDNLVDKYNAAKDAAIAATKAAYEYWSEQQRQTANAAGKENSGSGSGSDNQNSNSSSNSKGGSNGGAGGDGNLVIGDTATFNGQYYYDSYGTSPAGSKYSGVTNGIVVDRIIGNPYGIHIHSADGKYKDLGWIRKSQLSGYDTGGYTGTWGNDGRLALLHQKELVLNKEDTANMLNAVNIIRNITGLLGNSILGKMAAATAGNFGTNIGNDVLEQNVHIDAQFPNVKDSREIEDALNNLVNMASMRANKNNR